MAGTLLKTMKKTFAIISLIFLLAAVLFLFLRQSKLDELLHWKIYAKLLEAQMRLSSPPGQIKDIVFKKTGGRICG